MRTFGQVRRELKGLRHELEMLQADVNRQGPSHAELKMKERIMELNHMEELMWKQRARIQWLSGRDKNTHFFHLRASRRRKRNMIVKLKIANGQVTEDKKKRWIK